jgi:hypothetical protein
VRLGEHQASEHLPHHAWVVSRLECIASGLYRVCIVSVMEFQLQIFLVHSLWTREMIIVG